MAPSTTFSSRTVVVAMPEKKQKRFWQSMPNLLCCCSKSEETIKQQAESSKAVTSSTVALPAQPHPARTRTRAGCSTGHFNAPQDPLTRPYPGQYPPHHSSSSRPIRPHINGETHSPRMRRSLSRHIKDLFKTQEPQEASTTLRTRTSAATIGEDTIIGTRTGGRQGYLNPNGGLELRNKESIGRLEETAQLTAESARQMQLNYAARAQQLHGQSPSIL